MIQQYGKVLGNILLGFAIWFASSILLSIALNPILNNVSYYTTQLGFIVSAVVMVMWFGKKQGWVLGIRNRNGKSSFIIGSAIAMLIPTLATLMMYSFYLIELEGNQWKVTTMLMQSSLFLIIAIGEEVFFRGYLFGMVQRRLHTRAAILISTIIFAGLHVINPGAFDKPISYLFIEVFNIFLLGLLFAQARLQSGNVWMPIGLHFIMNFTQSAVFGYLNGGKEVESFLNITFLSENLLNGAGYGLESSLLLTPIVIIAMLAIKSYYVKKTAVTHEAVVKGV
jgi:uncharacterized protein